MIGQFLRLCSLRPDIRRIIEIGPNEFQQGLLMPDDMPKGRRTRGREGRSVSLCSLRSLRASMCQLFKIHKARGECQERTKFNDLRAGVNSSKISRDRSSLGKGQYHGPRRHTLSPFSISPYLNLRNVTIDFHVSASASALNSSLLKYSL